MTIKSLLLGSAAALAAGSGAHAADAIVAAEPEPVEYVRVCDAYGAGYFYIPGTETCLNIGGYLRFEVGFGAGDAYDNNGSDDWDAHTRAHLNVIAKSDTEYGTLTSAIIFESNFRPNGVPTSAKTATWSSSVGGDQDGSTVIDEAYLDIAGFRVGKFANWWDDDFSGETDLMTTINGSTKQNSIRYQYGDDNFYAGIALEELVQTNGGANNLGIDGSIGGKVGGFTYAVMAGYDSDAQEGAVLAKMGADIGPGTLSVAGIYSSGLSDAVDADGNQFNGYYDAGEWSVVGQYELKATDKFSVAPAVQYIDNIDADANGNWDGGSEWRAGVTLDYKIVENLSTRLTATYVSDKHDAAPDQDWVEGFFRLERDF
ncbi:porin [Rhizobium sp. P32RR-XVIII]|uniref:porin n=1 Tax=Rhizobium sp. P32RR-XVIII TaxID=2726738 RepID=UPI00145675EC|nr:porin [Rhizobium sp. P32RR-XVIII]NLS02832.1 porin [Rhizobium sp. P32RR-XVIII]